MSMGILSNFNHFRGLLFCTLEHEAQVCNRLQEVSTTALLETAIGAAVGDRGRLTMSGRVHDILASVLFHATYPRNLSNSKEPQGLLFSALHLLALRFGCLCSSSKQGGSEQPCHRDI